MKPHPLPEIVSLPLPTVSETGLGALAVTPRSGDAWVMEIHARWVEPLLLVAAAAIAQRAQAAGSWLHLTKVRREARSYLARMGLGTVIESCGGRHCLPTIGKRDRSDALLEVSPVTEPHHARAWAELVRLRAAGVPAEAADSLYVGLAEIGGNILEHSGTHGYVAAQTYPSQGLIRFAVADGGAGLRQTLAARGASTDHHALQLALGGASRHDTGAHGFGLQETQRQIQRAGGSLYLGSGRVAVNLGQGQSNYHGIDFPGTIFQGTVPATPPAPRRNGPGRHRRGPRDRSSPASGTADVSGTATASLWRP